MTRSRLDRTPVAAVRQRYPRIALSHCACPPRVAAVILDDGGQEASDTFELFAAERSHQSARVRVDVAKAREQAQA